MVQNIIKPKTSVLGMGGGGIKIVEALSRIKGAAWLNLGIADTDLASINSSTVSNAFPVGIEWTQGTGCAGDPERGSRAFAKSQKDIEAFIAGSSMLIVAGGLGGGSATGGASVVGRLARRINIPVIFLLTTPFSFEGQARHDIAEEGLKFLLPDADVIIPVPNDILFTSLDSETPAVKAFLSADVSMATAILGIAEIMRCNNLLSTDFADLKTVLGGQKTLCNIGLGVSDIENAGDRCLDAAEKLLSSPLLGGKESLENADAIIVSLIGGDDLQIGEMKQGLEIIRHMTGEHTRVITGVNTDKVYSGRLLMTVITVKYDREVSPVKKHTFLGTPSSRQRKQTVLRKKEIPLQHSGELIQGELAFQSTSRGHFSKTTPTTFKGEDIDIPPFQRLGITLDKGN